MDTPIRILTVIVHFSHLENWTKNTTSIVSIDKEWQSRSLFAKAWVLARAAANFEVIVFFYDVRVPMLFWLISLVRRTIFSRPRMVFTTLLCDISRFSAFIPLTPPWIYEKLRWAYYYVLLRRMDCIVVHTLEETRLYAEAFHLPQSRFVFVPYCMRADGLASQREFTPIIEGPYVLAAGRHRDFKTFAIAMTDATIQCVVIAGEEDREALVKIIPPNTRLFVEIPFDQYRALIANASVFVIPLSSHGMSRSLGQIAAFEAVARGIPVVAARTFQLVDYFAAEKEVLFYTPGDPCDLRRQVDRFMTDRQLIRRLTANARERLMREYTDDRYVEALLRVCRCNRH